MYKKADTKNNVGNQAWLPRLSHKFVSMSILQSLPWRAKSLCLLFLGLSVAGISLSRGSISIYVETTGFAAPYYDFFADSERTQPLDLYSGGSNSLLISETYTFIHVSGSHPFYISDVGYNSESSGEITLSGDGTYDSGVVNGESFTLSFTGFDPEIGVLYYYCTVHDSMVGTLNVIPEPATVGLFFGLLGFALVGLRRIKRKSQRL